MKAQFKGGLAGVLVWLVIFVYGLVYCFGFTCSDVGCLPCVVLSAIPQVPSLFMLVVSTLILFFVVGFLIGWVIGNIGKEKSAKEGLRKNEGVD